MEAWGSAAPELLRRITTLDGWETFNAAVKVFLFENGIDNTRYYVWPTPPFIRRFWFIAVELFIFELQDAGELTAQRIQPPIGGY